MAVATPWRDRFWPKVNRTATCWLWTGARSSYGYGHFFKVHHKPTLAHRVAWELTRGDIPADTPCVLHRCDMRLCVNPEHLFLGTKSENIHDRHAKGRTASGERSGNVKLTADDVRAIRARYSPEYGAGIALRREFGIGESAFYAIVNRQTWKDIG